MCSDFVTASKDTKAGEILHKIRRSRVEPEAISYIYVIDTTTQSVIGVVDLRDLILSADHVLLGEIMVSQVVSAEADDMREDLAEMFAKYHYRMIPVLDEQDRVLGVIHYNRHHEGSRGQSGEDLRRIECPV